MRGVELKHRTVAEGATADWAKAGARNKGIRVVVATGNVRAGDMLRMTGGMC